MKIPKIFTPSICVRPWGEQLHMCVLIASIVLVAGAFVAAINWPNGLLGSGGTSSMLPRSPGGGQREVSIHRASLSLFFFLVFSLEWSSWINRRSAADAEITTEISRQSRPWLSCIGVNKCCRLGKHTNLGGQIYVKLEAGRGSLSLFFFLRNSSTKKNFLLLSMRVQSWKICLSCTHWI